MRQSPRQLAPRRYALRLHHALALIAQLSGHAIEAGSQLAQFIGRIYFYARVPISCRQRGSSRSQLLYRPRDPRRNPAAYQHRQNDSDARHQQRYRANVLLQPHQFGARAAHQQHAQRLTGRPAQRNGVQCLGIYRIG